MRYLILECVLWFVALVVSFAIILQGEMPWLVFVASGMCMMLSCVKLAMCVELCFRHYDRVIRSHRF